MVKKKGLWKKKLICLAVVAILAFVSGCNSNTNRLDQLEVGEKYVFLMSDSAARHVEREAVLEIKEIHDNGWLRVQYIVEDMEIPETWLNSSHVVIIIEYDAYKEYQ